MGLHELTLRNFRLFEDFSFTPDTAAITVFLSPNGTGKTSILEAVSTLATGSSFRTSAASDMIRTNETVAEVHGVLFQQERRVQADLTLTKGVRNTTKKMLINGQRPKSRAELADVLPLTVFTPEGVDVVRGGPEHRRTYLTNLLTDVDPATADVVERFARILSQRNALLKALEGGWPTPSQQNELDLWTSDFVTISNELLVHRRSLLERLAPVVANFYQELAQLPSSVVLNYEPSWVGELASALQKSFSDDRYRGYTTIGPQRDDIGLVLEGRDARRQASQGEQRSFALALRLAGHELVRGERGVDPLLLLDDVFSELDPLRSEQLLKLLPVGQTLVTTASPLPRGMAPASIIDLVLATK